MASILGQRFIEEIGWTGIIGGGLVYLLIYALALTALVPNRHFGMISTPRFQSVAMYVIWFVFAFAFVANTFARPWPYLPFAALAIAALVVRILGNQHARQHSAATAR